MLNFGIKTILAILIISGVVAYIGDILGRWVGRRRLSFFGLRPRHTAIAFSILAGILIASLTIGALIIISQDARTALFGLEKLRATISENEKILKTNQQILEKSKNELGSIEAELKVAREKISYLNNIQAKLAQQLVKTRSSKVLFRIGETIYVTLIKNDSQREKEVKEALSSADALIRSFNLENKNLEQPLVLLSQNKFDLVMGFLKQHPGEKITKIKASQNTLWGEIVAVDIEVISNVLILKKNQIIDEIEINSLELSQSEIEERVKRLLAATSYKALEMGLLVDTLGSVGSVPYEEILKISQEIKKRKSPVQLATLAKKDIYTIGPLEISFKINPL